MSRSLEKEFGKVLKEYRNNAGHSQESLALKCGLDRTYISLLERGLRSPTINTIFSICSVLNVRPSQLISKVEERLR